MKEKKVTITAKGISQKQWSLFLIELNLMAKSWKKYVSIIDIKAKNFDRIIKFGMKKHGDITEE
jgi:hypothetical protein